MALALDHAGVVCKKHVGHALEESVVPGIPSFITNATHIYAQVRYSTSCVLYAYTVNIHPYFNQFRFERYLHSIL